MSGRTVFTHTDPGIVFPVMGLGTGFTDTLPGTGFTDTHPGTVFTDTDPGTAFTVTNPGTVFTVSDPGTVFSFGLGYRFHKYRPG